MDRGPPLIFIFFISLSFLWGQAGREQEQTRNEDRAVPESEMQDTPDTPSPFPLGPILLSTLRGTVSWRPDWALTIPPDAFRLSSGQPVAITLSLQGLEYRIRWDKNGSLVEFPLLFQGQLVQAEVLLGAPNNKMKGLVIGSGLERPWGIDFIGAQDAPMSTLRVTQGDMVYFVALRYNPIHIAETWYDQEGKALADFTSLSQYSGEKIQLLTLESRYEGGEAAEWYYYDSFGNISEINGPGGIFSALYSGEQHPRYWKRQALDGNQENAEPLQQYTLQWDERGFLVRIAETPRENTDGVSDLRYEYTLDARGNWIERREIRMIYQLGVLVPSPGLTVKRVITYRTGR